MRASSAMHQKARTDARQALLDVLKAEPTANELRFLLAEGLHDSTFGSGWHDEGVGSNNIGAIHSYPGWSGETFSYTDSHPDGTRYIQTFKKYPTAIDGWRDLVREFYIRRPSIRNAARSGSAQQVATEMVRTSYAEGFGADESERIAGWAKALQGALDEIDGQGMPSIMVRVEDPQGKPIGTASISDAVAPGLTVLAERYGAPVMVAYPAGWRFLLFAPDVIIPAVNQHPYRPLEQTRMPTFSWQSGIAVVVMGASLAILAATVKIQPGRTAHAART